MNRGMGRVPEGGPRGRDGVTLPPGARGVWLEFSSSALAPNHGCTGHFAQMWWGFQAVRSLPTVNNRRAPWWRPYIPNVTRSQAAIMTSATPSASGPGTSPAAPEERGLRGPCHHPAWPLVATRRAASNDHAFTKTHDTSCLPSASVILVRKMLESVAGHCRYATALHRRQLSLLQMEDAYRGV
jgi:hypothetical protein